MPVKIIGILLRVVILSLAQLLGMSTITSEANTYAISQEVLLGLRFASLLVVFCSIFVLTRVSQRLRMLPHSQTLILMIFIALSDVGGIAYHFLQINNVLFEEARYPLYLIRSIGNYGTKINTALIGLSLLVISYCEFDVVSKSVRRLQVVGIITPILLSSLILSIVRDGIYDRSRIVDSLFWFQGQEIADLVIVVICLLPTVVSLVKAQRDNERRKSFMRKNPKNQDPTNEDTVSGSNQTSPKGVSLSERCEMNEDGKMICYRKVGLGDTYEHNCQMLRHFLMLVYLSISMVIGNLI